MFNQFSTYTHLLGTLLYCFELETFLQNGVGLDSITLLHKSHASHLTLVSFNFQNFFLLFYFSLILYNTSYIVISIGI